jgi:hypothetical protein
MFSFERRANDDSYFRQGCGALSRSGESGAPIHLFSFIGNHAFNQVNTTQES